MVGNRKAETEKHRLLKYLIAAILEGRGGSPEIESDFGDSILDVFDKGMAYEVQTIKSIKAEQTKLAKYLLHCEIEDVMFIYVKDFDVGFIINSDFYKRLKFKLG